MVSKILVHGYKVEKNRSWKGQYKFENNLSNCHQIGKTHLGKVVGWFFSKSG